MDTQPLKKFAIFAFPRSGSTYLCSRLTDHPDILCHFEVFHPREIVTVQGFLDSAPDLSAFTPRSRDEDPAAFLRALFHNNLGARAVGFKIFIGQSREAHEVILADRTIAKILLTRSTIDAYISMEIAQKAGKFVGRSPAGAAAGKVYVDAGGLLTFDERVNRYFGALESRLRQADQAYLKIRYEDIVASEDAFNAIFGFLGVERGYHPLSSFTERQNSDALEDKVLNLKEFVEELVRLYREDHDRRLTTATLAGWLSAQHEAQSEGDPFQALETDSADTRD